MAAEYDVGKKLEFMAAVNLVPPAVMEEINRRQMVCRAELGNWWEREHSKDFCLVPRDPVNRQSTKWIPVDANGRHTEESLEHVESIDVPTPDYAIEISSSSSQDNYMNINHTNGQTHNLQQFFTTTSSLP